MKLVLTSVYIAEAHNKGLSSSFFQDPVYSPLKNVCNAVFKRLHAKGIGIETEATPISPASQEDVLWNNGILSLDNPLV